MQNVFNVWYNLPAGTSDFLLTFYTSFAHEMMKDFKNIFIIFLTCLFALIWKNPYSNWLSISLTKDKVLSQNKEFPLHDYTKCNTIMFGFFLL